METNKIDIFLKDKLTMYQHLKSIRDNLWSEDGKSRVSVMVGAGFSLNANKIEETFKGMALWSEVRDALTVKLSHHLDINYKSVLEIGEIFEEEYGRASLDEVLKETIPDDNYEPSELHYKFLNLPWTDIYTTNYDTLLERAKRQIYERKYQVIYDAKDIPNSTSPRIIKLHGSFPSNRPFTFTESDYRNYPIKFSPFVNMVQQSIMETTFILIGFSGDDPNFEQWTTWVKENLGEQMPKIYMIGYRQKHRLSYLKSKGITLIDFEELYPNEKNAHSLMFKDLFDYFTYKNREEKTKWPYKKYNRFKMGLEDLAYNREHFPGWIVIPDHIRRENADNIRNLVNNNIFDIKSLEKDNLKLINEYLWCLEHFNIPLENMAQKHLSSLVIKNEANIIKDYYKVLWFLLNQARFDCDIEAFSKYKTMIEKCEPNNYQRNEIIFEEIMLNIEFNNMDLVKSDLKVWHVGEKEIEWGIKKAALLLKINEIEETHEMLEGYLQTIRNLLAIQSDDYRLLSLESIALHLLGQIKKDYYYGYDRLNNLSLKNCDVNKEFEHMLISIKPYVYDLGTKTIPGFDPGKGNVSSKMGDYFNKELLDSYAVSNIKESYNLIAKDHTQYDLALKNLEIIFPNYSLIKRIYYLSIKRVNDIFTREYVYKLEDSKIETIFEVLKDSIEQRDYSIIDTEIALELISRIYFSLSTERKQNVDLKVLDLLNNWKRLNGYLNSKNVLSNLLERMLLDKNNTEQKLFFEKLFTLEMHSQQGEDRSLYTHYFFEPFLVIFSLRKDINEITVAENKIETLLDELKNNDDESIKEIALIRLTFLAETNSLPKSFKEEYVKIIKEMPTTKLQGISDFIFNGVFDRLINNSKDVSTVAIETFLSEDIPTFYQHSVDFKSTSYSHSTGLTDYFNEIQGVFPSYIRKFGRNIPDNNYYRGWIDKFYKWWTDQEEGLLRNVSKEQGFLQLPDYLKTVVIFLKNNMLSVMPLEVFEKRDCEMFIEIFSKIESRRPDLSLFLVPSFQRLAIPIKHSFNDIITNLKSKEQSLVIQSLHSVYDYLILIDNDEIEVDKEKMINELFNMLYYCSDSIFKNTVDTIRHSLKNTTNVYTEEEVKKLLSFVNSFLNSIKKEEITFNTLKDFEVVSSLAGLVTFLSESEHINISEDLTEWVEYIENHRLPEVREYRDFLNF